MSESTIEIWRNKGRGLFIATKLSMDGSRREEPVPGGREFQVEPADRRAHQGLCRNDDLDPYRNGTLAPVNDAAKAALSEIAVSRVEDPWSAASRVSREQPQGPRQAPMGTIPVAESPAERVERLRRELAEAEADAQNPSFQVVDPEVAAHSEPPAEAPKDRPANVLTDAEEDDILRGNGNRAKSLLARITSAQLLGLLHDQASSVSTPARVQLIERRWIEVDPNAKIARRATTTTTGDDLVEAGPQGGIDPESPEPRSYALEGIDSDDPVGERVPLVPGDGIDPDAEPGPSGVVMAPPVGVQDGPMSPAGRPGFTEPD